MTAKATSVVRSLLLELGYRKIPYEKEMYVPADPPCRIYSRLESYLQPRQRAIASQRGRIVR